MTQPRPLDDVTRRRLLPPVPVAVAPMAGGPSTPELVAAVVGAGGGGFLAGGMRTAAQMREQVAALRALLGADGPDRWGVNLFVPDVMNTAIPAAARTPAARSARADAVAVYRSALAADGHPDLPSAAAVAADPDADRAGFEAMLAAAEEQAWPLVSFTFGLPDADVFARLAAAGIPAGTTVTDAAEARAALDHGAAFLVVQGHRAGGHRGSLDPAAEPSRADLSAVLAGVRAVVGSGTAAVVPVVAAGGVGTAEDVRALLAAGADTVAAGTAFLLTPEAGTSAAHRDGVAACAAGTRFADDDGRARTALTRAYTGRWARSLATGFMAEHSDAPAAYPEVNVLTKGLRTAAAAAGDLERVHLWAGTEAHRVRPAPAADVLAALAP